MKDIQTLNIDNNISSIDAYNRMANYSKTSYIEAQRTIEAIDVVRKNNALLSLIKEVERNGRLTSLRCD